MAGAGWHGGTDDVQVLVDDLAERLGRSVVVNDPLVRLMYTSRHFSDEDPVRVRAVLQRDAGPEVVTFVLDQGVAHWPRAAMLPGSPAIGLLPRLCAPLRGDGRFLGLLMVIDAEHTLTTADVAAIEDTTGEIAALLAARTVASDSARSAREQAVRLLVSADAADRDAGRARLVEAGFEQHAPVVVTVAEVASERHGDAQVELALRSALAPFETSARVRAASVVERRHAVLVQMRLTDVDEIGEQSRRLRDALRRSLGGGAEGTGRARVTVGAGGPVDGLAEAGTSHRQAEVALRGGRRLPRLDGIGVWDRLGEFAVLLSVPDDAPSAGPATAGLRALDAHESGPRLRETLRAYLDHAGSAPRTAAALNLHRTSLYYRLRQIAEITGTDLDDGRDRLVLHLALRLDELR